MRARRAGVAVERGEGPARHRPRVAAAGPGLPRARGGLATLLSRGGRQPLQRAQVKVDLALFLYQKHTGNWGRREAHTKKKTMAKEGFQKVQQTHPP